METGSVRERFGVSARAIRSYGSFVLIPAVPTDPVVTGSGTNQVRSVHDRCVSFAAGQEVRKLPFSEIARSMSGNQPTAAGAGSDAERLLWPTACQ